jgi:hypothetical protein
VFSLEELAAHPTYGRLPGVESGQMGPWNQDFIQSHQGLTAALETLKATLQDAADVTPYGGHIPLAEVLARPTRKLTVGIARGDVAYD